MSDDLRAYMKKASNIKKRLEKKIDKDRHEDLIKAVKETPY